MLKYSYIIPMYNVEEYIENTLASILKCDCSEAELILVNDGSADNTLTKAESVLADSGVSYTILDIPNSGVSNARNLGIDNAKGEYLIFVDSDDLVSDNLIASISNESADMVCWTYDILQRDVRTVSNELLPEKVCNGIELLEAHLLNGFRVRLGSFAVKRELVKSRGVSFTSNCTFAEDMEFIMKCMLVAESVALIPISLYTYCKREGSLAYSYNIRRFDAPRAIVRVSDYILENKLIVSDRIKEYIDNGLFVLHTMYSVDSCAAYTQGIGARLKLLREINQKYSEIEDEYNYRVKRIKTWPGIITEKRKFKLKLGFKLYILLA